MADPKPKVKLSSDQIDVVIDYIIDQIGPIGERFGELWNSFSFYKLMNVVIFLAGCIEQALSMIKDLDGESKKDVLVGVINRLVDVPLVPEYVEGWAIEITIDQVISWLNKRFGKDWLKRFNARQVIQIAPLKKV